MSQQSVAYACKGEPKTRETVHLCNRATPGTPPQALRQWSCPHATAKVNPKRGKRFTFAAGQYLERRHRRCGNGRCRTTLQRCTQNAENGTPLQKGSTGNAATGAVAMVVTIRPCKGEPKTRKTVHLCNRATPGTPLQTLQQWY